MRARVVFVGLLCIAAAPSASIAASRMEIANAGFTATNEATGNVTADVLDAPANLNVQIACLLIGVLTPVATLTWTPSQSAATDGYVIERWSGGLLQRTIVVDAATTSVEDGLGVLNLGLGVTYTWRVRATASSWQSPATSFQATTPLLCL